MKKTNLLLISLLTATAFALTACNGGGGSSSICQNCNPFPNGKISISVSNPIPLFGESFTITATLPATSTQTMGFISQPSKIMIQNCTIDPDSGGCLASCQITNGTSCAVTATRVAQPEFGGTTTIGAGVDSTDGYEPTFIDLQLGSS